MKQLLRLAIAVLIGVLATQQSVLAEDLCTAWQVALDNDQVLQAGDSRVAAARADLDAARAGRLPGVAANAGVTRFDQAPAFDFSAAGVPAVLPLFGGESMSMADARVTLPLYTGGALTRGIDAAGATLSAEQHRYLASTQQIKLAVAAHYIDVLRARSALAVADSNVKSLAAHLRDVDDMFRSGSVARNDYLSAAVSLADSEQRRLQASNQLDLASAAYNRALGRSLDSAISLDENLPGISADLDLSSLEALTEVATASRSELDSLDAAASAYRNQASATRATTRPQLALTGGYVALENDFLNSDEFWMVGVGVTWNLFDGGQARKKASALSFRSNAVLQERNDLRSKIELQVRQAWLRLNETRERKVLSERVIEQAEENLRVVRDRYRNGEGTNTEVLDAEMLRNVSRSNYDTADFDAKLALYELARGVGRL